MKTIRIIYLLIFAFNAITLFSNTKGNTNNFTEKHLEFLGIEIDGTIFSFIKKMESVGFSYNEYESSRLPKGQIKLEGCYNTHNADLTIFYNRKSSIVYKLELSVLFDSLEKAQQYLRISIDEIENKYTYITEHDLEDATSMHYVYRIMQNVGSQVNGTIKINPTTSYLINEKGDIVGSKPLIEIVVEDSYNSSLLTPSTTAPSVTFGLIANDSSFFKKNYEWAMNYKRNYCYEEYKFRLDRIMNCYKYNYGVPEEFKDKEEEIEKEIMAIDKYKFCTIKTAYSKCSTVYRFENTQPEGLGFIVYELGGVGDYIKLNAHKITQNISLLEKLKELYNLRRSEVSSTYSPYRSETIDLIPVTYGKDNYSEGFGSIHWEEVKLSVKFVWEKDDGLQLEVSHGGTSILSFCSINDIDEYIDFLKSSLL